MNVCELWEENHTMSFNRPLGFSLHMITTGTEEDRQKEMLIQARFKLTEHCPIKLCQICFLCTSISTKKQHTHNSTLHFNILTNINRNTQLQSTQVSVPVLCGSRGMASSGWHGNYTELQWWKVVEIPNPTKTHPFQPVIVSITLQVLNMLYIYNIHSWNYMQYADLEAAIKCYEIT